MLGKGCEVDPEELRDFCVDFPQEIDCSLLGPGVFHHSRVIVRLALKLPQGIDVWLGHVSVGLPLAHPGLRFREPIQKTPGVWIRIEAGTSLFVPKEGSGSQQAVTQGLSGRLKGGRDFSLHLCASYPQQLAPHEAA